MKNLTALLLCCASLVLACSKLETGQASPDAGHAPGGASGGDSGAGQSGAGGASGAVASGGSGGSEASGGSGGSGGTGGIGGEGWTINEHGLACMGRWCGNQCVPFGSANTNASACGPDCIVCPAPEFGLSSCVDEVCGWSCEENWHACGDPEEPDTWGCKANDSPETCGDRCEPCPAPEHSSSTACVDGACTFSCEDDYLACLQEPECFHVRWGFDDGTIQGFELRPEDSGAVTGAAAASMDQQYDGTHSLRVPYDSGGAGRNISVHIPLCGSGGMDLRNRTLRMMVRLDETEASMVYPYTGHIQIETASGVSNVTLESIDEGQWTFSTGTLDETATEVLSIGFYVYAQHNAIGFMYLDDIAIE